MSIFRGDYGCHPIDIELITAIRKKGYPDAVVEWAPGIKHKNKLFQHSKTKDNKYTRYVFKATL